jgi:hypothetical protein
MCGMASTELMLLFVSLPTTELYTISGSDRRSAEMRRAKERLQTQLLAGDLALNDPSPNMSPGAGPLSRLGVTGDLSSLLNSPTQAKAVPSDEADDDVRCDVPRRVCAS